ncbi:MAG TPA: CAP domain-containing protein [Steroidobacter sp.]|nr:CAP domain-containing protein [Steroidobacter sp.]
MNALTRLLGLCSLLAPLIASASTADVVNAVRKHGCKGAPGTVAPLHASRGLDAAAKQWSLGGRLKDAFTRDGYHMVNSASMRIAGARDEAALRDILTENYCEVILNASFKDIGVYESGDVVSIVVAEPFTGPSDKDAAVVSRQVLQLVNQARSSPRKCGARLFRAAAPLKLSPLLERAARVHARDMAAHSLFEHRGSDSGMPADRVARAGYRWQSVAENIAAGSPDASTAVRGWIDSPGHCANLMGPQYSEMGVAYAVDPKSSAGVYWAQVFASPR